MLNKFFDKVYLINLKKRKDRYDEFLKISQELNFEFELKEAFDGVQELNENFVYNDKKFSYITNNFYKNKKENLFGIENYHERYFKGAVGCLISHLEILKDAEQKQYKSILILEDDVYLIISLNECIFQYIFFNFFLL